MNEPQFHEQHSRNPINTSLQWQQDFCARIISDSILRLSAQIEHTAAGADTTGGGFARFEYHSGFPGEQPPPPHYPHQGGHRHHHRPHHHRGTLPDDNGCLDIPPYRPEPPGIHYRPAPCPPESNYYDIPPQTVPQRPGYRPPIDVPPDYNQPQPVPQRPGYRQPIDVPPENTAPRYQPPTDVPPYTTPTPQRQGERPPLKPNPDRSEGPLDFGPIPSDSSSEEIGFPPRRSSMPGSRFMTDVLHADPNNPKARGVTGVEREQAILAQIEAGNVPDFLRHPKTLVLTDKQGNRAELKVMPDYLAIGTNEDFVRVPVTPVLAKAIADKYGFELPTQKVCDSVYANADIRPAAQGLVQSREDTKYMDGNGYFLKHDRIIDGQVGNAQGALIAGHKKDIIISRYAKDHPDKLDFYGFFDANGQPIQGSGGGPHENTYVDYSHGARFVSKDVIVNGKHMNYDDVLRSSQYSGLLSNDGPYDARNIYKQPVRAEYAQLVVPSSQAVA